MTLRGDLDVIAAQAGLGGSDLAVLVSDEHERYEFYLKAFALAPPPDDRMLLCAVLRDPDAAMGNAAAVEFVGKRAQRHRSLKSFASWAGTVSDITSGHDFLCKRISEWADFKRITEDGHISDAFFDSSSDWLQRKLSEELTSAEALAKLADRGRTRRVRNTAQRRLSSIQRISGRE